MGSPSKRNSLVESPRNWDYKGLEGPAVFVNQDGQRLFRKEWKVQGGEPKAICFLAHGLNDHCERYEIVAKALADAGVHVFAHDHYGNGRSPGPRCVIKSISETLVRDVVADVVETKKQFPSDMPVFILGISLGGMIAILAGMQQPTLFKGVALNAPAVFLDPTTATPFKVAVGKFFAKIFPNLDVGKLDMSLVTRDAKEVEIVENSPLHYKGGMKARMGVAVLNEMQYIEANIQRVTFPFLVTHGTQDKICNVEGTKFLSESAPSKDRTVLMYEGSYHDLFHELQPDRDRAVADTVEWIVKRIPEGAVFEGNIFETIPSAVSPSTSSTNSSSSSSKKRHEKV